MSGLSSTLDLPCGACDGLISAPGFFPHQVCPLCSESICSVCWTEGTRSCKLHADQVASSATGPTEVWRGLARSYEAFFIDAFLSQIGRVGTIPHPAGGKPLTIDPDEYPLEADESVQLDRLLDRRRDLASEEVRGCPQNRRLTLAVRKSGFLGFGSTTELVLVAACVSRLERYVSPGHDADPLTLEELQRHIDRWALAPETMHYLGVLSPTGWGPAASPEKLSTATREVILIEPATDHGSDSPHGFAFRTRRHPNLPLEIAQIFDPESEEAKMARAVSYLARHPDLVTPGGVLLLEEEREKLAIERTQLEQAVAHLVGEDHKLIAEELDGEWVLRRRRN